MAEEKVKEESFVNKGVSFFWKYLLGGIIPTAILTFILLIIGANVSTFIISEPFGRFMTEDHPTLSTGLSYMGSIGVWVVILIIYLILRNRREYLKKILNRFNKKTAICLLVGLVIGVGLNLICAFAAMLNKDISLYFNDFNVLSCIFLLISVFVQASSEELLCRGFMYRRIETFYNQPIVPIIANSAFFAVLHGLNPGVTIVSLMNIFLTGILFSCLYYYTDSISLCFTGHTGWNFCQSIILGLPNSGVVVPYSFMKLDAANARNSLFYNCAFGVDGTVFSVIILGLACVVVIVLGRKGIIRKAR